MLRPCFSRRDCKEPAEYPTPELEAMLEETLRVPLLPESAMRVAMVCASLKSPAIWVSSIMTTGRFTQT
jgi:error-prone DNA polymerase